jgi:proton-dependent oligopeptide transporter, POT family
MTPISIAFWDRMRARGREPDDIVKIALGCAFFALGCVLLTVGQALVGAGRVPLLWLVPFHLLIGTGYLLGSPVALAVIARSAPAPVRATLVGGYYIGLFLAGFIAGWLGRFYEPFGPPRFWLLHAGVGALGALILLALRPALRNVLSSRGFAG